MLSDKDLHGVYDAGAQTDHMSGLRAVWAKAIAWEREEVAKLTGEHPVGSPENQPSAAQGAITGGGTPSGAGTVAGGTKKFV